MLYKPDKASKREGFVFCDGFGEEKLWSQRIMVAFATLLAKKGYPVLRFDYMGNGESEGAFEESTLTTMISDTRCAIQMLLRIAPGIQKVNLLGLRLGALIAALVAEKENNIGKLVLWAPVINGNEYIKELFRVNFATQLIIYKKIEYNSIKLIELLKSGKTVNVDGYEMSYTLFDEIRKNDLFSIRFPGHVSVFISEISKTNKVKLDAKKLIEKNPSLTLQIAEDIPFWQESKYILKTAKDLFYITESWLDKHDH